MQGKMVPNLTSHGREFGFYSKCTRKRLNQFTLWHRIVKAYSDCWRENGWVRGRG